MDILDKAIEELDATQKITTTGGSYPEAVGILAGLAASAGILASGGLLGVAFVVGGAMLLL
jgi:hypothetical protein